MSKYKILLLFVLILAVIGVVMLAMLVPFTTRSEVSGYEYRVNTLRANWYLWANGYSKAYSGVKIYLVDAPQTGFRLTGKEGKVLQSVSAVREGNDLVMRVQYDPIQRDNYARGEGGSTYTRDLYMYLCLAMQGDNPHPNDCYKRAEAQIVKERWLPGVAVEINKSSDVGWRFVGRVHAQACAGTIPCGGWTNGGTCSVSGKTCNSDGDCQSGEGSCVGGGQMTCDTSLNPINCNTLSDQNSCQTFGYVSNCNLGCNTSAENFCSWGGSGGGGGGSSCPGECRQGSSCGAGYSGASGCSGSGPGGGCKSNQVCCSANSCGGGGGGSVQCVPSADCPPGTVKSATVSSSACDPICGNNA